MRFHWQNLNDEIPKKYWWHGRCWFYFTEKMRTHLEFEWTIPSRNFAMSISLNDHGEDAIAIRFAPWIFSIYIALEWWWLYGKLEPLTRRRDQRYTNGRTTGFYTYDWTIVFHLWHDPMESRRGDHSSYTIDLMRVLKGKADYSSELLETRVITVPMPEKEYPAVAKRIVRRWTYPRWWTLEHMSVEIDLQEGGIPFEGKGENSWDCGPDATSSFSCGAKTITEAVGQLVGSMLSSRVKNGGWGDYKWMKPTV